jgi:hypothetical protein
VSRPDPGSPTRFDAQAAEFDRRVGLPEKDCRGIAAAVLSLADVPRDAAAPARLSGPFGGQPAGTTWAYRWVTNLQATSRPE